MRSVGVAGSVGAVKGLLSCVGTGEGNCTGCLTGRTFVAPFPKNNPPSSG